MIKLVFISNILDQSMIGFCDQIAKEKNICFTFVTVRSEMSNIKTRLNIDRNYRFDYSEEIEKEYIKDADVLIIGHAPDFFIKNYIKTKLVFKSSERLFKENVTGLKKIKRFLSILKHHARFQCKNFRYLGIGNGAMEDIKKTHLYKNRAYKWIYFPEIDYTFGIKQIEEKERNISKEITIVWAGRMVECKNLPIIIETVKKAIDNKYKINLNIIGDGPLKESLEAKSKDYHSIIFMGLQPLETTIEYIKNADFLFMASDKREGWGMVVNNAINYGTNIIGNSNCGSVSTLLTNNNAFLYSDEIDAYETLIKAISSNSETRMNMAKNAYIDYLNIWSPMEGAKRFAALLKSIIEDKKEIHFDKGLFS